MYLAVPAKGEIDRSPDLSKEALQGTHNTKWQAAMNNEMNTVKENGV